MATKKKGSDRFVLVCTKHRGVFMGRLVDEQSDEVHLEEVRMCVYWPVGNRGVLGLASHGPVEGARITPAIPSARIPDVTFVGDCTPEAVEAWRGEPWS